MTTQTKEQAFESTVESMLLDAGWVKGAREDWDVDCALFAEPAIAFMRETQPEQWNKMRALHHEDLESRIIETLTKELDTKGSLHILRRGFKFPGQTFRLAYLEPAHGLNDEAPASFQRNELLVTRQARGHLGKGHEIDLLLALNSGSGNPSSSARRCAATTTGTGGTPKRWVGRLGADSLPNSAVELPAQMVINSAEI